MSSRRGVLALLGMSFFACTGGASGVILSPEVSGAQTLLIAHESAFVLRVSARDSDASGPLFESPIDADTAGAISLVYLSDSLELLGLVAGPMAARSSLDPLPPFLAAYRIPIQNGEVGPLEEVHRLEEPLASFLYPHPEGCTEVTRGGRTICVPNGCPGNCEREFCFESPRPLETLDSPYGDDGVAVVREGNEVWLYFSTHRWTASSTAAQGAGQHAKVRLLDATTPDLDSLVALDDLALDAFTRVERPSLSRDGLELAFSAVPTGGADAVVQLSHRTSVRDPFALAEPAIFGLDGQDMLDPLILLDPTIFLVWSGVPDKLTLFRRVGTEPGAVDFTPEISLTSTFSPDPLQRLGEIASFARPNLSCDGWHLLFMRKLGEDVFPATTLIARHAPLEFARFIDVPDLHPPPGQRYTTWSEHPDCSAAYLSDGERLYVAKRRPCTP